MPDNAPNTRRSILLFHKQATSADFAGFLDFQREVTPRSDASAPWRSARFNLAVVPYDADTINIRDAWEFGIIAVTPERRLTTPVAPMPESVSTPLDHLSMTGALRSSAHGDQIRVAIFDTGFDFCHPDFANRDITAVTYVGNSPQDEHGHGTHCTGLACGPRLFPNGSPAYGVADRASIVVVRIADRNKMADEGDILKGLDEIVGHADIISLSFNAGSANNEPPATYERVGRVLLDDADCLLIGAAGNEGNEGKGPVQQPANCNAIMAVGSVGETRGPSVFSPGFIAAGDPVDIVAPGEGIYSSWLLPTAHAVMSGTSQAAPIAAGLAALWAEQTGLRGLALWEVMLQNTKSLRDFRRTGFGLLMAP